MTYRIETTNTGKWALIAGDDGETKYIFESELAAQTACDAMNRAQYEPVISPYWMAEGACEGGMNKRSSTGIVRALRRLLACSEPTGNDTKTDRAIRQAERALAAYYGKRKDRVA